MPSVISLLRGINVGGRHLVRMEALRGMYDSLGLRNARTYVQSGNVVFESSARNLSTLSKRIEDAIEASHGFRPAVIHRTEAELRAAIAANPFSARAGFEPAKMLLMFLPAEPAAAACAEARLMDIAPEEMHFAGRELYLYLPNGVGRAKVSWTKLDRILKMSGTGRNWNTVLKLAEMAAGAKTPAGE